MDSITNFHPAPNFGFLPFNWGIVPKEGDKNILFTLLGFINLFPIEIYQNCFREETDADQCYWNVFGQGLDFQGFQLRKTENWKGSDEAIRTEILQSFRTYNKFFFLFETEMKQRFADSSYLSCWLISVKYMSLSYTICTHSLHSNIFTVINQINFFFPYCR
jgi:hypothetical protein